MSAYLTATALGCIIGAGIIALGEGALAAGRWALIRMQWSGESEEDVGLYDDGLT